jgi:hypothetical protein
VPYSGLTGTVPTWNQNTTGNAATATNVPYSGLTGTVPTWNQSTTGNAAGITGLTTPTPAGTARLTQTVWAGTLTLATTSIPSLSYQAVTAGSVNSVAATGVLSTDTVNCTANGSLAAVTGFTPSSAGGLTVQFYPTAGYVNANVENWTSGAITPGTATFNCEVTR